MLDYRGLEALCTVIEVQSFEAAAKKLFISQSAVSQRLKSLQSHYGDPLLIRKLPYKPTELGAYLLGHFKQVCLLETSLSSQLKEGVVKPKISIALSRDSLETWFMGLINSSQLFKFAALEVLADDQEITRDYLKKGLVSACFSTNEMPIANCQVEFLGYMNYLMVASPEFKDKYFSNNQHVENLLAAPAVKFDSNDDLHFRYLQTNFEIKNRHPIFHMMPSVKGFRELALKGYAYALIPELDIRSELENKKLISLFPNKVWKMPVYLHTWSYGYSAYQRFYQELASLVSKQLA